MNGILIMIIAIVVLGGAYLLYGRWLAKTWASIPMRKPRPTNWRMALTMSLQTPMLSLAISSHPSPAQVPSTAPSRQQFSAGFRYCSGS